MNTNTVEKEYRDYLIGTVFPLWEKKIVEERAYVTGSQLLFIVDSKLRFKSKGFEDFFFQETGKWIQNLWGKEDRISFYKKIAKEFIRLASKTSNS